MIHFDGHGDKTRGLEVGIGENVSWAEPVSCLRPINIPSGGNLVIGLGACHGFHALSSVDLLKPSPFYLVVGPTEEVSEGSLEAVFQRLYQALFQSPNAYSQACKSLPKPFLECHSEVFFTKVIAQYFKERCMGKSDAVRRESFVSLGVSVSGSQDIENIKNLRRLAKREFRPNEEFFNKLAEGFLVDRNRYKVTYGELMSLIQ